jgi:hypothetical protein
MEGATGRLPPSDVIRGGGRREREVREAHPNEKIFQERIRGYRGRFYTWNIVDCVHKKNMHILTNTHTNF